MSHLAWEHCHEGFIDAGKYQHVLKDSLKKINNKCADAEPCITKVKTPEDKISKIKKVFVKKCKGSNIQSVALKTEHNEFMLGFGKFFQSSIDSNQGDNIEWSDSSSSDDNPESIHYISRKNAPKFKRRCYVKKKFHSLSKSAAFLKNIDSNLELEKTAFAISSPTTPPEVNCDHIKSVQLLDHSQISSSEIHKSHKQFDEQETVHSYSLNLPTFSHAILKKSLDNKKNDSVISGSEYIDDFKNNAKELLDSIHDVASENESEKGDCYFQYDESSSNASDAENPQELECLETISRVSSNSSSQAYTIRASDWVLAGQKQKTPVKIDPSFAGLGQDSAKKKKKYEKGTLACRMNQLLNWEKSSVRFWYHSVSSGFLEVSERKSAVLKIITMKYQSSVYILKCLIIDTQELCKAIISKDTVDKLTLKPSMTVQIFPPWQELKESKGSKILLCTNFVKVVQTLNTSDKLDTSLEVKSKECITLFWNCLCLTEIHMSSSACPASKYPVSPYFHHVENTASYRLAIFQFVSNTSDLSQKRSFLESMKGIKSDQAYLPTFVAKVLRVLKYNESESNKLRCQLLTEDEIGSLILIKIPSNSLAMDNIYKLEKHKFAFSGLSLVSRIDKDRHPDLFSLVELVWNQPFPSKLQHITSHSESQQLTIESPNYAYILDSPGGKESHFHIEEVEEFEADKSFQLTELCAVSQLSRNCRISFVAKLVYRRLKNGNSQKVYVFDDSCNMENQTILVSLEVSNNCILDTELSSALFRDVRCHQGVLYADIYTGVFSSTTCTLLNINIVSSKWERVESSKLCLPAITSDSLPGSFVTLQGIISSIDDSTAYTWEECPSCCSDQLATLTHIGSIICLACSVKVEVPQLQMKMEAIVYIPSANLSVKIDLSQKTIKSVLPPDVDDEGYDIDQVINQSVNCPICLVQEILSNNKKSPKFSLLELNYNVI